MRAVSYSDGGNRGGNPGRAACCAVVIPDGQDPVVKILDIGLGTNNDAEYRGLILALEIALDLGITDLRHHCDANLVVKQVLGTWPAKKRHLWEYVQRANELARRFDSVTIEWVPREQNTVADAALRDFLDDLTGIKRDRSSNGKTASPVHQQPFKSKKRRNRSRRAAGGFK